MRSLLCLVGLHSWGGVRELVEDPEMGYVSLRECLRCEEIELVRVPGDLLIGEGRGRDREGLGPWETFECRGCGVRGIPTEEWSDERPGLCPGCREETETWC